jgi:hypothetical protein
MSVSRELSVHTYNVDIYTIQNSFSEYFVFMWWNQTNFGRYAILQDCSKAWRCNHVFFSIYVFFLSCESKRPLYGKQKQASVLANLE